MKKKNILILFLLFLFSSQFGFSNPIDENLDSLFKYSNNQSITFSEKVQIASNIILLSKNDTTKIIEAYSNLGSIHLIHSSYSEALENFHKAISLSTIIKDTSQLCENNYFIGNTYLYLNEFNKALDHYQKVVVLAKQLDDQKTLGMVYNSRGIVFSKQKELNNAFQAYRKSLMIFKGINFEYGTIYPLLNIGDYYLRVNQPDTAIFYFDKVLDLELKYNDIKGEAIVYGNYGLAYHQKKQYKKALAYYNKSLSIAIKSNYKKIVYDNYKDISDTYKSLKNYNQSIIYLEKYHSLKDSIFNNENDNKIAELQNSYEIEKKEKEVLAGKEQIKKLEYSDKINRFKIYLSICLFFIILLSSIFIVARLRISIKKKKEIITKNEEIHLIKEQLIQTKLTVQKEESIRLEKELKNKNEDLTNFALDIARKNEFTQMISSNLKQLKSTSDENAKISLLQELIFKTNNHLKINEDFEHFQNNIEKVNHDFFENLNNKFPGLTTNEKHLCGLIRLNLTIKDISSIKNISPKSVEMNRYRLRKKLNLSVEDDLNQIIQNM